MKIYRFIIQLALLVGITAALLAPGTAAQHDAMPQVNCKQCHVCDVPTRKEPCLKSCPRNDMVNQKVDHPLAEAPDSMLLDDIQNLYMPVHFNHRLHASMSEMGGDCANCHHYSPKGKIPPCKDCHGGQDNPANLRQPSLKGAYHRQCLSCHREWSHDTKCVLCHVPRPGTELTPGATSLDSTDIMGISHPVMTEPVKKVYVTPYKEGPIVTFQHKEHIDLFGFRCVDCHKEENCSYCHDIEKPAAEKKTQEQVHAICNDCHLEAACSKCHDNKERPGFTHNSTGWPLNKFHNKLDCWACHPTGKRISRLDKMCVNCHSGWNSENFRHAVTGLKLDEIHSEMDCTDCHPGRKYESDPACSDCHDDGRTAKDSPPGVMQQYHKK
ncbi:MAG TPA: cytochrome c3 family protein [candidate division Zixibacteria bacterium]|nr:cytochrome c3 family protein [candidate division Zixibacteria bacterium]